MFDDDWVPDLQLARGRRGAAMVRRSLQGQGGACRASRTILWDDTRPWLCLGHHRDEPRLAGWAAFFNDPANSKVAGNVGVIRAPKGSAGKRTGWSGFHSFSVTEGCDNKEAAASFVDFLTNDDSQMVEARRACCRPAPQVWDDVIAEFEAAGNTFTAEMLTAFQASMAEDAFTAAADPGMDRGVERDLARAAGRDRGRQDGARGAGRRAGRWRP